MTFIAAQIGNFDGLDLVGLSGASVSQIKRFTLTPDTYRLVTARSVSPVFTPTGGNAVLGGFVDGSGRTFLVAPESNFSGEQLLSLSGALLSKSPIITGLLGGVAYRAMALTTGSGQFDVSLSWVIDGTLIEQAPTPTAPETPSISEGIVSGPAGSYRMTNGATVSEAYIIPPFNVSDYGVPGDTVTVEFVTYSLEGPEIVLPVSAQIMVSAVGTLSRSGATVTLTPATWDTAGVTVTRTKTIAGVTTALVGTTFTVGNGETYFVTETATKTGTAASDPASTATGSRPAASPFFVGGKGQNWRNTVADQTVSLTNLSGGIITAPQEGDLVVITVARASNVARAVTLVTSGYTTVVSPYANDSYDTNQVVAYKRMTATPDTDVVVAAAGDVQENHGIIVQVWRDVNIDTPLDVAAVSTTGTNGAVVIPPAITPATSGAAISMFGAAAVVGAADLNSAAANFVKTYSDLGTYRISVAGATATWSSGTYTPTSWGGSTNTSGSWTAVTLALRPAA